MIYLLKEEHRRFFLPRLFLSLLSLAFIFFLPKLDGAVFLKMESFQKLLVRLPYIFLALLFLLELTTSLARHYRGKEHILLLYPLRAEEVLLSKLLHLLGSYSIIYWIHVFALKKSWTMEDLVVYLAIFVQFTFFILIYYWIETVQVQKGAKKGIGAIFQFLLTLLFFAAIILGICFLSFFWTPKDSLVLQLNPLLLKRSTGVNPLQYLIWSLYIPIHRAEGLFLIPLLVMFVLSLLIFAWLSHLFESRIDWYRKE